MTARTLRRLILTAGLALILALGLTVTVVDRKSVV